MTVTLQHSSTLNWPAHLPATERVYRQVNPQFQYNMTEREAVAFVEDEIARTTQITAANLCCDAMNLTSTAPVQYLSKNSGAILRLRIDDSRFFLPCDRWQSLAHNIYALHLGLRYFRQMEEWGLGSLPLLMGGFIEGGIASPSPTQGSISATDSPDWQRALGLGPTATLDDANAVYRHRAKIISENDPEKLQDLNIAIQQARLALQR